MAVWLSVGFLAGVFSGFGFALYLHWLQNHR
jgi:uncharacterized protein involved in exopolysaccharide biosynthesis